MSLKGEKVLKPEMCNLQWGSPRTDVVGDVFEMYLAVSLFIFAEHLLGLMFILTVLGECCRKSVLE